MEHLIRGKLCGLDGLIEKVEHLKTEGKKVVLSHGVFDLVHPGIIKHLSDAKSMGDILIVTLIRDEHVKKGFGRPVFPDELRAENVASLEQVDFVCVVDDQIPFECIKKIQPDIFAKGIGYKERDRKIHDKIFKEEQELYFGKTKIFETDGFSFSSTEALNGFRNLYSEETKKFFRKFSSEHNFDSIVDGFKRLRDLKVLLIGDGIIDEYYYCESMGKSPKSQLIVNKYLKHEVFAGGAFAIANHVSGICDKVHMVTLSGGEEDREKFILGNLRSNIDHKFFYKDDSPTVVKTRFINVYQNQKMFEINYIDDSFMDEALESNVIDYLKGVIGEYDLVLISDFGHGLITDNIIRFLEGHSKKLSVNAQTNGANAGYNLITKYKKTSFISLDVPEARLATQDKFNPVDDVARKILENVETNYLMITLGSEGSLCIDSEGAINHTPAFSTNIVDIIGAGDAFFSYTAPCFAVDMPMEQVAFIGNAVGALAVQVVGNKRPVEKHEVLKLIETMLNTKEKRKAVNISPL